MNYFVTLTTMDAERGDFMKLKLGFTFVLLLLLVTAVQAKTLTAISIEGLENEREKTILGMIPLSVGDEYSAEDVQKIIKVLYNSGRFRTVKLFAVNESETESGLHIVVEENPYLYDIEFYGNKKLKASALREVMKLRRGELLSDAKIHRNVVNLRKKYFEKGYLKVDIDVEMVETTVPGSMILKVTIKENNKIRIEEVTFSGNEAFDDKKLRRKFKTKARHIFNSGEYNEVEYRQHLDSLILFYNEEGYMDARIVSDSVGYVLDSSGIAINVQVEEGKRYYVGDFYFQNNTVVDDATLQMAIALRRGKPFERSKYLMSEQMVGTTYRNEGYLWSQVSPEYKFRGDTVDVVFSISEGRPAIVRKVDITGNNKTREQVIRRELRIYPGQKYNQSAMERSIREVHQLNYFDNVIPDIVPHEDGTIDLIFDVQEKENIGQFSAGVTYSQIDGFGGNFSVSIPNFRGAGEQFDATIEVSKERQRYSVGFVRPWIFNRPTSFSSRIFFEKLDYGTKSPHNYQRTGLEVGLGKRLKWPDDYFSVSARYLLSFDQNPEYVSDEKISAEEYLGVNIPKQGLLNRLYLALMRDDTDFPQFPTKGSRFSIAGYLGFGPSWEEKNLEKYNFVKGVVSYDWYMPLFWKVALGTKAKFGLISSFGDSPSLGYNDLFYVGGVYRDGVVRGYSDNAPLGEHGVPGLTMLTLSAELRVPIIDQQFYLAYFFDAGNSWAKIKDISLTDLYPGTGFGFRLMLPMVGLLGFDFAWGLRDRYLPYDWQTGGKSSDFQLHFQMNRGF